MENDGWIDISVTIKPGMVGWPGDPEVQITRIQDMDSGDTDNVSLVSMGSHTGTHIDAPRHYFTRREGIDKMPLNAAIGPARVLAIEDLKHITVEELKRHSVNRGDRILFKTRNSAFWKTDVFQDEFVYIPDDAAEYLACAGVSVIGIDYLSVGGYRESGIKTHRTLLGAGIWIIEGLNLSSVAPGDYDLICLPLKILNADGAPARAVIRPRPAGDQD